MSDFAIFTRDAWTCRMRDCLCPGGRAIDPATFTCKHVERGVTLDPWRASIDHVIPLAAGGWDIAANKRAAHQLCNEAAQPHWRGQVPDGAPVPEGRGRLRYVLGDVGELRAALESALAAAGAFGGADP